MKEDYKAKEVGEAFHGQDQKSHEDNKLQKCGIKSAAGQDCC